MNKNFTRYAFTDSVKKAQARYGTRDAYKAHGTDRGSVSTHRQGGNVYPGA